MIYLLNLLRNYSNNHLQILDYMLVFQKNFFLNIKNLKKYVPYIIFYDLTSLRILINFTFPHNVILYNNILGFIFKLERLYEH